jgi:hypothetical protein
MPRYFRMQKTICSTPHAYPKTLDYLLREEADTVSCAGQALPTKLAEKSERVLKNKNSSSHNRRIPIIFYNR